MITDLLTPDGSFLIEFDLRPQVHGQFTSISYFARFVYPTNLPPTRWVRIKPGYFQRLYRLSLLSTLEVGSPFVEPVVFPSSLRLRFKDSFMVRDYLHFLFLNCFILHIDSSYQSSLFG